MKNDAERNFDREAFDKNFELIFGKKEKTDGNKESTNTNPEEENND